MLDDTMRPGLDPAKANKVNVPFDQTLSVGSATFRYFELFSLAALFYIVCVQLIGVVWRVISGRAARAPLGI